MLALGADIPPPDPTLPEPGPLPTFKVQAISLWNALLIGIVTGFAVSIGTVMFQRAAKSIARPLIGRRSR